MQDNRITNAKYAWVPRGYESKVSSLFVRGKRYTTIAVMSAKGVIAASTFEGPADADAFKTFITNHLVRCSSLGCPQMLALCVPTWYCPLIYADTQDERVAQFGAVNGQLPDS